MPVSDAFSTGVKPVFKMKTRLGREIRATGNHKFLTIHGWKRLDELQLDDYLAIPHNEAMQLELEFQNTAQGLYKRNLSRERALRVAGVVQSPELQTLAERDIYWDSILSIEPDGEEQVYDLTVPSHHNFVANNIIVR